MTEQPAEPMTEQEFLGNAAASLPGLPLTEGQQQVLNRARQSYLPNGHRLGQGIGALFAGAVDSAFDKAEAQLRELAAATKDPDLWFDTETQTTRALREIQDGNINAGIACLQAALAFAQNYRHSLTEETI